MPRSRTGARILDAAARCFVRNGFHRTTMQDVASEAAMSAGNLYRYFPSKEAIVAGLTERDRTQIGSDFEGMVAAPSFLVAFEGMGRKHLIDEPREKAVLAMEIWSEATRNPNVHSLCGGIDCAVRGFLSELFTRAKRSGEIAPEVDVDMAAKLLLTLADGLMKRRALEADFDGERELAMAMAVFRAVFSGAVTTASLPASPSLIDSPCETVSA
jgi:TetR/AcrR family transcriptional repressor of uid operon